MKALGQIEEERFLQQLPIVFPDTWRYANKDIEGAGKHWAVPAITPVKRDEILLSCVPPGGGIVTESSAKAWRHCVGSTVQNRHDFYLYLAVFGGGAVGVALVGALGYWWWKRR